ncbi:MAG: hypothetical protein COA50_14810 [Flavobacteriaceae bacterium]|nr:MAG: hypothetical protein COA50_14810 [Flavobacteriaceae bacterium]
MKKIAVVLLLLFLASCSQENLERKIVSSWKVEKMQRDIRGIFQDIEISPNMLFQFEEKGKVKIVTQLGQTIRGSWTYSEEIKTIRIVAKNESKDFIIDSLKNNKLYLTSGDVKFQLKKGNKSKYRSM